MIWKDASDRKNYVAFSVPPEILAAVKHDAPMALLVATRESENGEPYVFVLTKLELPQLHALCRSALGEPFFIGPNITSP